MSNYHVHRCSTMDEYIEKNKEYQLAKQESDKLRSKGMIVHEELEFPLPPEGFVDDFVMTFKMQYIK